MKQTLKMNYVINGLVRHGNIEITDEDTIDKETGEAVSPLKLTNNLFDVAVTFADGKRTWGVQSVLKAQAQPLPEVAFSTD